MTDQQTSQAEQPTRPASLREALNAAANEVNAFVSKEGYNQEHRYSYAGHEDVVGHVRGALLRNGVVIVPTLLRLVSKESFPSRGGDKCVFVWEQAFEILHVHSDDKCTVLVQVTTHPGDKASFIASTSADRTLLMRLMRLATTNEGEVEYDRSTGEVLDQRRGQQQRQGQSQRGQESQQMQGGNAVAKVVARLVADLAQIKPEMLGQFYGHARAQLSKCSAPDAQVRSVREAFDKRCRALGVDPSRFTGQQQQGARA